MSLEKKKIEEFISKARQITDSQKNSKDQLLFKIGKESGSDVWDSLLDENVLQDPEKTYDLFYNGIQSFLTTLMPKKTEMRTVILEMKTIMLTGKELSNISYGTRGADSRMSKMKDMEKVIDILTEWSTTPDDFFKLANLLLQKNISLGFSPEDREFTDYLPKKK